MIDELRTTSNILKAALERYLDACLTITSQYELGSTLDGFSKTIVNELQQTVAYEAKIDESKKILRKVRNRCTDLVPISSLPPELLSHVFVLSRRKEQCFLKNTTALSRDRSRSLESLLHICSYWRSIALVTPALWSHIDIAPFHRRNKEIFGCAKMFAANAGQAPLDIHISMGGPISAPGYKHDLFTLCASIATRARSFQIQSMDAFERNEITIFEKLFANCVPRKLTRFLMIDEGDGTLGFMIAKDAERPPNLDDDVPVSSLDVPHSHFEEVWRYVTVLRLNNLYPYWTSQAYHGLVKLHLAGDPDVGIITTSQLAGILSASPQLRFFYFGTLITIDDDLPPPVRLDSLEVFHLDVGYPLHHDSILRIISPGAKPLRISITLRQSEFPCLAGSEHGRFFARSNVTQLHVNHDSPDGGASLQLPELLTLVPNLRVLSLDGFDIKHRCEGSSDLDPVAGKGAVGSRLAKLHLTSSAINPDVLRWLTEAYPIQEVTINEITCWVNPGGDPESACSVANCRDELLEIQCAVKFVRGIDPVQDENWD